MLCFALLVCLSMLRTLLILLPPLLVSWLHFSRQGVLRIAGGMKRADPDKSEAQILMRAMRDTNLPKFVQADFGIFLYLINDLFPKLECPAIVDPKLSAAIKTVITDPDESYWVTWGKYGRRPSLQPEESFVGKCVNLAEAMSVRHCVFVLGTAGAAKTELWKTLAAAQTYLHIGGGKTQFDSLNPKAVTSNELYGYVHPVTKEPYDGVIAKIMREFSAQTNDQPKWMVLDGDIDAEWIESMNTVMDDNKVPSKENRERARCCMVDASCCCVVAHAHTPHIILRPFRSCPPDPHPYVQRAYPAHAVDAPHPGNLAPSQRLARHRLARRLRLPQRD